MTPAETPPADSPAPIAPPRLYRDAKIESVGLANYIETFYGNHSCEICGKDEWASGTSSYAMVACGDGTAIRLDSHLITVLFMVFCLTCGNTKMILSKVIDEWLEKNS